MAEYCHQGAQGDQGLITEGIKSTNQSTKHVGIFSTCIKIHTHTYILHTHTHERVEELYKGTLTRNLQWARLQRGEQCHLEAGDKRTLHKCSLLENDANQGHHFIGVRLSLALHLSLPRLLSCRLKPTS